MSVTSADPDRLQTFLDEVRPARRASQDTRRRVASTQTTVRENSPDYGVDVASLSALTTQFASMRDNERFVTTIRAELLRADRNDDGTATVGDAAVADALDANGVAAPPVSVEFEGAALTGLPPTSGFVDDPICAANGNMVHQDIDLVFPGLAATLDLRRTYNSLDDAPDGVFGRGWSSMLDARLTTRPDGGLDGVQVRLADGALVRFVRTEDGWAAFGRRVRDIVERGEQIAVVVDDTTSIRFDRDGALTGWTAGRAVVDVERADGRIRRVTERGSGRWYEVEWTSDTDPLVASIVTSDGRSVRYRYDDTTMVRAESAAGHLDYEWHDERLTAVVDADGVRPFRNRYDEQGRVVHQLNPFGRGTEYRYQPDGLTVVVGDDDVRQAMIHDARGNLTAVVDVDGSAQRFEYDHLDRVVRVMTRGGAVTQYRYDRDDRLVERVDADGLGVSWTWDERGRVTSRTLRDGGVTTFEYRDDLRSPVRIVDPTGAETTAEIDDRFDSPSAIVDPDGVVTRFEYDDDGQPVATVDGVGGRTEAAFDAAGRLERYRDATGGETRLVHDDTGRLVRGERGRSISTYEYTAAGRVVGGVEPGGAAWSAVFGEHGAPVALRDAFGAEVLHRYDAMGNRVAVVAPDGTEYRTEYDAVGRPVAVIDPDGGEYRQVYDRDGHVVEVVDPNGATTRRELDPLGRTVRVVDAAGGSTTYGYHPNGEIAWTTTPDGRTWRTEVDAGGRTTAVTDPAGRRAELEYTPAGRLLAKHSPAGHSERFEYDAAGRASAKTDAAGVRHVVARDASGRIVSVSGDAGNALAIDYDDHGLPVTTTSGDRRVDLVHDDAGRLIARSDATGATVRYDWDARGLLAAATDPAGGVTRYDHDVRGRLVAQTVPGDRVTGWSYDVVGRLATTTDPAGIVTRLERDAAGNVTSVRRGSAGWDRELDALGRETMRTSVDGDLLGRFEYDDAGRIVAAVGPGGWRTELLWDDDRLVGTRDPNGIARGERDDEAAASADVRTATIARQVDGAGRLLVDDGGTVHRYDGAGRLVEVAPPTGPSRRLTYRSDGLIATERVGDTDRRFDYDDAGRVHTIAVDGRGVTSFEYDDAGRRVAEVRPDGSRVEFGWSGLERLIRISTISVDGNRHDVDVAVDGLGRPVSIGERAVRYDPISGRPSSDDDLIEVDPAGGLSVDGLTFLGRRVLDAEARQFLSPDPLHTVPGSNGAASAYTYAWQDPINFVDPSGMRPISQEEWAAMREMEENGRLGQAWNAIKEDPWGSALMVGMVVGAVALGGPVGVGILIGAGIAAGTGLATGTFDPRQVILGGALGAVGGHAGQMGLSVGARVALGAGMGSAGNLGSQVLDGQPGPIDWWSVGVSGAVGAAGARVSAAGAVDDFATVSAGNAAIAGGATDAAGSVVQQALTGDHTISLSQVMIDAAGGAANGYAGYQFDPTRNPAGVEQPQLMLPAGETTLLLEAGASNVSLTTGDVEMVTVYRGTSRPAELEAHAITGALMSDAALQAYYGTMDLDIAIHYSGLVHENAVTTWGSEADYVEAHGAFGHEIVDVSGDRTMVSVTTDPAVAEYYADKGPVFTAEVPVDSLIEQTLPGAGESEYLARHAIEMTPIETPD